MTRAPRLAVRALVALGVLAGAWASLGVIDTTTMRVQRRAEAGSPPRRGEARPALPPGRVFVLIIDSLRAQSAEEMPTLRALRGRSLFVHVDATQDAATVPSLRAAFSGQTQRSIFAFARNFVHGSQALPSIFSQLAEEGGHATVFSDGSFYELAPGAATTRANEAPPGEEEARQRRAFADALALYRAGTERLVVFHLTTVDHVAHWHAVGDPTYAHAFAVADALVRESAEAVAPEDTLVIMGDHGHDEAGRHFPGLRVPTVALYRGPRFSPGVTLGPAPLTLHRYLLSWALGLPLTPAYRGLAVPGVLVGAPPPPAFVSPPPEISTVASWRARAAGLLFFVVCCALAGAFAAVRLGARRALVVATPAVVVLFAVFFVGWGAFLAHRRLQTRPPVEPEILAAWAVGLALAVGLAWRGRRRAATWLALALPALLLYPSAAWDGWGAAMGPAWLVALVVLALDWARRRRAGAAPLTRTEALALATLPLLAALLLPFFYAETDGVVAGDWRGYLTSDRLTYWIALSAAAKLVIFARPRRGTVVNVAALGLVGLFSLVSFGGLLPSSLARLAAAAFLASAAFASRGVASRRPGAADGLASAFATAALLMLYRATVVLDERNFLQLELLLAALRLSALAGAALGRAEDRGWFAAWLEGLAVLVAAWTTLALTLHRLEWTFLYRFLAPPVIEARAGWLLPLILARYAIPLVLARRLLAEARPPEVPSTWRPATTAFAVKLAALVLMTIGSAILDPTSEPFRGAVQNVLTLSVLALAFVYEPRAREA